MLMSRLLPFLVFCEGSRSEQKVVALEGTDIAFVHRPFSSREHIARSCVKKMRRHRKIPHLQLLELQCWRYP